MHRQAILIQDISGFRAMVDPFLSRLVEPYICVGLTLESVLLWIIREEIWKVYQLPIDRHTPRSGFEQGVYYQLIHCLEHPKLNDITGHFIKVPRIYGDNTLTVELNNSDLSIYYYINKPLTYPS